MGKRRARRRTPSPEQVEVWVQATVRERLGEMKARHQEAIEEIDRLLGQDGSIRAEDVRRADALSWPHHFDAEDLCLTLEKPERSRRQYAAEAANEEHRIQHPMTHRLEPIVGASTTVWVGELPSGEQGVAHLRRDCYQFRAYRPARRIVEDTATMTEDLNHILVSGRRNGLCGSCARWDNDALVASGLARLVQLEG